MSCYAHAVGDKCWKSRKLPNVPCENSQWGIEYGLDALMIDSTLIDNLKFGYTGETIPYTYGVRGGHRLL